MINNRQAGRRNRGRNNQSNGRPNGGNNRGGGDNGNRIDNRARGNATQLHEKYRNLARDAQLSGDRVNVEYYLQFADHYFRVLADNRARQEEQSPQRFRQPQENAFDDNNEDFDGDDFGMDYMQERPQSQNQQPQQREPNQQREPREQNQQREPREQNQQREPREQNHQRREPREPRDSNQSQQPAEQRTEDDGQANVGGQRNRNRMRNNRDRDFDRAPQEASPQASVQPVAGPSEDAVAPAQFVEASAQPAPRAPREVRPRRPRVAAAPVDDAHEDVGLDMAVLPPAISRADNDSDSSPADEVVVPRKRGRPRRVTTEAAE